MFAETSARRLAGAKGTFEGAEIQLKAISGHPQPQSAIFSLFGLLFLAQSV
jgi:hypothetical protein